MLSGIIRSLVADLRLDGYAGAGDMPPPLFSCPKLGIDQPVKAHTFEEERALLGCYIIGSRYELRRSHPTYRIV